MKTFKILHGDQNLGVSRLLAVLILSILLFGESCDQREIKEYDPSGSCFTKEFLENEPWVKDQLAFFQMPRQGALRVAVYRYRGQDFLAFENPSLSSPMSYIFSCEGKKIEELGIWYEEFYGGNELLAVVLEAKY